MVVSEAYAALGMPLTGVMLHKMLFEYAHTHARTHAMHARVQWYPYGWHTQMAHRYDDLSREVLACLHQLETQVPARCGPMSADEMRWRRAVC